MGIYKEVFHGERYVVPELLVVALRTEQATRGGVSQEAPPRWTNIQIWTDSEVVIALQ